MYFESELSILLCKGNVVHGDMEGKPIVNSHSIFQYEFYWSNVCMELYVFKLIL